MNQKKLLFFFGRPFSFLYSLIMGLRSFLYKKDIFKSIKLSVPVFSVGNLTMGGTGKTPTTYYIAKLLTENGYAPSIISRGYSGKAKDNINLVSDQKSVILTPALAGDEPYMLAKMLPGVPIVTGKKRIITTQYAVDNLSSNALILDDGFQHLPVKRDCNLALFDSQIGFGNDRVFPGGDLRESHSALARASAFVITGKDSANKSLPIYGQLNNLGFNIPIFSLSRVGSEFFDFNGQSVNHSELPLNILPFCGIGNPERFFTDLDNIDIDIKHQLIFDDHQVYTDKEVNRINDVARKLNLDALLTTEKDFVKLQEFKFGAKLYYVRPTYASTKDFDEFLLSFLP